MLTTSSGTPIKSALEGLLWDAHYPWLGRTRSAALAGLDRPSCCHPERSEGSGSTGAEMLRGVYPERSEGLSRTARTPLQSAHRASLISKCLPSLLDLEAVQTRLLAPPDLSTCMHRKL